MIVDVFSVLQNLLTTSIQYQSVIESNVDGEIVKNYSDPTPIQVAILPMAGQDLKNTPEGQYTFEDKVILTDKNSVLKLGDLALYQGVQYEIKNEIDLGQLVNIKKYYAKRIGVLEP